MTSTSRSLQSAWNTVWQTAPPAACETLRNLNNTVAWGQTCVFAEEDGGPTPFSINTACMPWVTSNIYPSTSAFYSPATACPTSWTAVATQTSGSTAEQWVDGETAISCCPSGFQSDGGSGCRPGSQGNWTVVECGDADADENELKTYAAAAWPATATASVSALHIRYQASDIASASATAASASSSASNGGGGGSKGLSTGVTAAIAAVAAIVFLAGVLGVFLLWRRRRHQKAAAASASDGLAGEKGGQAGISRAYMGAAGLRGGASPGGSSSNETPEWNAELDASELDQQRLVSAARMSAMSYESGEPSELGGISRKPISPVEIDGKPVTAELEDTYVPQDRFKKEDDKRYM